MVVVEGNGSRPSHHGDGYKESETMYTLNCVETHAISYGIGRPAMNQGYNARFSFQVEGEKSPTIIILKYAFIPYKITIRFFAILRGVDVCNLH